MRHDSAPGSRWVGYFVLAARLLLAFAFLSYGLAKLRGGQFGVSAAELSRPLGQPSLFRVYWYLCDYEPFKTLMG